MINKRYKIKRIIGKGRSTVFLCSDSFLREKEFAIKILNSDDSAEIESFENEYKVLNKFDNVNIIKAYDYGSVTDFEEEDSQFGVVKGSKFIVFEFFEGFELQNLPGIKTEAVLRQVIVKISSILYYLHQSNYIHYDIKPENFLANFKDDVLELKLIDFGFVEFFRVDESVDIKGTPEYLAPEIIQQEFVDHRADLYSFGILIYKLIFGGFPFNTNSEVDIYNAHLDGNFKFPSSGYSEEILSFCKSLLSIKPIDRPYFSLSVFDRLGLKLTKRIKNSFLPSRQLIPRKQLIDGIDLFINDEESNILIVRSEAGFGKSTLLKHLEDENSQALLVSNSVSSDLPEWRMFLYNLLYRDEIILDEEIITNIEIILSGEEKEVPEKLKKILFNLASDYEMIFLFDQLELFDEFSKEVFINFIKYLQVNNQKVIISENESSSFSENTFTNITKINITEFSKQEIEHLLEVTYASFMPLDKIKELYHKYCDANPSNFINNLIGFIELGVLNYSTEGPLIDSSKTKLQFLEEAQELKFARKMDQLDSDEQLVSQYLSLFNVKLDEEILSSIIGYPIELIENIVLRLQEKNILYSGKDSITPQIKSEELKNFIYNSIDNKTEMHESVAIILEQFSDVVSLNEISKQYLLGGNSVKSREILLQLIEKIPDGFALQYKIEILNSILKTVLPNDLISQTKLTLAQYYSEVGDFNNVLKVVHEILDVFAGTITEIELKILDGQAKIETGDVENGVKSLKNLLPVISDINRNRVLILIATGQLDLSKFDEAEENLKLVQESDNIEDRATAYNLLGLVEIYSKEDFNKAAGFFRRSIDEYTKTNNMSRAAAIRLNLGNIYSMIGEQQKAVEQWEKTQLVNKEVGNLSLEANLLMNFGINSFDKSEFENSVEKYENALAYFRAIGDLEGEANVLYNLSETYMEICEYQSAYHSINKAVTLFKSTGNLSAEYDANYCLAKFYFELEMQESFNSLYSQFQNIPSDSDVLLSDEKMGLLKAMSHILNDKAKIDIQPIKDIYYSIKNVDEREIKRIKGSLLFYIVEIAYTKKDFYTCIDFLTNSEFEKWFGENVFFLARKQLYLGKLHEKIENFQINTAIAHFQNAYRSIENESINLITIDILYEIADFFYKRGKHNDAVKNITYSSGLINLIAGNIEDNQLKEAFLNQSKFEKIFDLKEKIQEGNE